MLRTGNNCEPGLSPYITLLNQVIHQKSLGGQTLCISVTMHYNLRFHPTHSPLNNQTPNEQMNLRNYTSNTVWPGIDTMGPCCCLCFCLWRCKVWNHGRASHQCCCRGRAPLWLVGRWNAVWSGSTRTLSLLWWSGTKHTCQKREPDSSKGEGTNSANTWYEPGSTSKCWSWYLYVILSLSSTWSSPRCQ